MKRFITLVLALIMALSLCACGGIHGTKETVHDLEFTVPTGAKGDVVQDSEAYYYNLLSKDDECEGTFWIGYNNLNKHWDFGTEEEDMMLESVQSVDSSYKVTDTQKNSAKFATYSREMYLTNDNGDYALIALINMSGDVFLIQETGYKDEKALKSAYNSINFEKYSQELSTKAEKETAEKAEKEAKDSELESRASEDVESYVEVYVSLMYSTTSANAQVTSISKSSDGVWDVYGRVTVRDKYGDNYSGHFDGKVTYSEVTDSFDEDVDIGSLTRD